MSVLAWGFIAFLLIDKLLFRGKLAGLFVGGWRDLTRLRWNRVRRLSCRIFGTVLREESSPLPESPVDDSALVVCKSYMDGLERSEAVTNPEAEQSDKKEDTFTSEAQSGALDDTSSSDSGGTEQGATSSAATQEKAGHQVKNSEWDSLRSQQEDTELSPQMRKKIVALLDQVEALGDESPPFSEEEQHDKREPAF